MIDGNSTETGQHEQKQKQWIRINRICSKIKRIKIIQQLQLKQMNKSLEKQLDTMQQQRKEIMQLNETKAKTMLKRYDGL